MLDLKETLTKILVRLKEIKTWQDSTYHIIEEGSATNWVWRKLSDGTFEAWYSSTGTMAITTQVGSVYQSGSNSTINIPSAIGADSITYADVKLMNTSYGVWTYMMSATASIASNGSLVYRGMSASSRAAASYEIRAYVRGTYISSGTPVPIE